MPPARYNNLKIAVWLLVGLLAFYLEPGVLANPGHGHEVSNEISSIDTSYNPHCRMLDSASAEQECENDQCSPQHALLPREPDPLLHFGIETQLRNAFDLAGIVPVSEPPPNQKPQPYTTLPAPLPARLAFCCLRT